MWKSKGTCSITYWSSRSHSTECSNLSYFVSAILFAGIFNHFVTSVVGKVHIDIRRRWTFRVKETFERNLIFKRVNIGNAREIGNHRTRDRSSNVWKDTIGTSIAKEISYEQKVRCVSFLGDNTELIVNTGNHRWSLFNISTFKPSIDNITQGFIICFTGCRIDLWEHPFTEWNFGHAVCHNFCIVGQCFRDIFEILSGLLGSDKRKIFIVITTVRGINTTLDRE